jgi:hypothetical protein
MCSPLSGITDKYNGLSGKKVGEKAFSILLPLLSPPSYAKASSYAEATADKSDGKQGERRRREVYLIPPGVA